MGVSGGTRDLTIKVTLDSSGAVLGLQTLDKQLDSTKESARDAQGGLGGVQNSLLDFPSILSSATLAFGALSAAAAVGIAAIKRGAEVSDVEQSFAGLSQQAGILADTFLNQLNAATGQTIDNLTLQREAIEAVRAGAKPDEFIQLTQAARQLAEQTGGDTLTEMQNLSRAFETGNVKALQNKLGVIDVEKAERQLAAALGVAREELTKEGQVQAARNAILAASAEAARQGANVTNDAADNLARLNKIITDNTNAVTKGIAENEKLNRLLENLAIILTKIDFSKVTSGLIDFVGWVVEGLPGIQLLNVSLGLLAETAVESTDEFDKLKDAIKAKGEAAKVTTDQTKLLFKSLDQVTAKLKSENEQIRQNRDRFIDSSRAVQKAKEEQDKHNKALEEAQKLYKKLNSSEGVLDYRRKIEELVKAFATGDVKADEYLGSIEDLRQAWVNGGGDAQRFAEILIDEQGEALDELATQIKDKKDEIESQSGEGGFLADLFGLDDDTGQALGDVLGDVVQTGFDVLNTLIQGGEIDTAQLISSLTTSIGQGIGSLFGAGELGGQIGSLVGNLINSFAAAFGGDSAGTKARKAADKFFADAFDAQRLSVLINGQLVQIADLVFGGNSPFAGAVNFGLAESGFFNVFNSLPQAAQNAFNGVGLAFAAFLGDIEHLAGTLGAVFVNNIGGSLNNLQQLILATGVSVEDLEKALIEAALNGEISFVQAQGALDQLRQVMQQGIPDAVGAVVQAFQNLRNASVTGGRFAVDALKDIAAEARELGLHTIPDVLSYLVSTGQQSAESVQILQNALAAFGITTLEQLQNLSNETAIAILANLQANNFPFEETQSQIDALREQLASIPQNIQRNLIFNVRVNGSQEDIDFVRHAQVTIPGQGPGPA